MRRHVVVLKRFECPICQFKIDIPRKKAHMTGQGHLKWIWCPRCKVKNNFVQVEK